MQQPSPSNRRQGFTLCEMLVVLGLLVGVTALAQPVLSGALSDSRLRSGAKLVRVELAKARLRAMKTGIAQQFRHELGKNRFEVAPLTSDQGDDAGSFARDNRGRRATAATSEAPVAEGESVLELQLPSGVSFDEGDALAETTEAFSEDGWSAPIVFYPNGQTKNAHLRLAGDGNTYIEVSLRGLTGVATAGRLQHDEEALR